MSEKAAAVTKKPKDQSLLAKLYLLAYNFGQVAG